MRLMAAMIGVLAAAALGGPAPAAAVHAGPASTHVGAAKPRCVPPKVAVFGRVSASGALGWRCTLPPAPNCGKHAKPGWHLATSTWTCEACPPGELAYSTPAPGGGRFGHCTKPPPGSRERAPTHLATHSAAAIPPHSAQHAQPPRKAPR